LEGRRQRCICEFNWRWIDTSNSRFEVGERGIAEAHIESDISNLKIDTFSVLVFIYSRQRVTYLYDNNPNTLKKKFNLIKITFILMRNIVPTN
jgi:hypothetical protein